MTTVDSVLLIAALGCCAAIIARAGSSVFPERAALLVPMVVAALAHATTRVWLFRRATNGADVESQRPAAIQSKMDIHMFATAHNAEVFDSVIVSRAVDMVNLFPLFKDTPKVSLHDVAVLKDSRSVDVNTNVAIAIPPLAALPIPVALSGVRLPLAHLGAITTDAARHLVVVGGKRCAAYLTLPLYRRMLGRDVTSMGTILPLPAVCISGRQRERRTAVRALKCQQGAGILSGHRSLQSADVAPVAGETVHRLSCASILPFTSQNGVTTW